MFPPELAPESVTLLSLSMTWCVSFRPRGFFLLASCPKIQPPRWTGGHAQLPHWGVTAALGKQSPLTLSSPRRISPSLSLCFSLVPVKQMIFCSWWLRNTRLLYVFLCDPQTIRQCLSLLLLSVHLVLSWQHSSSDIFALLLFFFYCLWSILQMNVYCPHWKWKKLFICFVLELFFMMMGCLVKIMYNKELQTLNFPQIINAFQKMSSFV